MRGLVKVFLERLEMNGDGTSAMETIGQIPGSCKEYLDCESELVGASQEWLGRRVFFPRSDKDEDQR